MQRIAGFFLILASLLGAASLMVPPMNDLALVTEVADRVAIIETQLGGWYTAQGLLAAGIVAAALGLVFFAVHVLVLEVGFLARLLAFVDLLGAVAAGVLWVWLALDRFGPLERITAALGTPDPQLWTAFSYVFLGALVLASLVMFLSGYPGWFGILVFLASGALLALYAIQGSWDPIYAFAPTILMGIGIFFAQPARLRRPRRA